MDNIKIACCGYPTTVIAVDDNEKYHNILRLAVDDRRFFCRFFNEPQKALEYLKKQYVFNPFTNRCMTELEDIFPDHRMIDFNIRAIHEEAFNANRFKEIAIVVLDYAMPEMTGGELAEKLKGAPYKIILLTGEADIQTAINLFNEGVIHSYIRKDDPHFDVHLDTALKNLQAQYFQDLSRVVLENFPNHSWSKDLVFKQLFDTIRIENDVIDFFQIDEFGSFHFLNAQGESSFLVVADEDMMKSYVQISADYELPVRIREGLKSKMLIPFFLNEEDFEISPAEWVPYMHPAQILKGLETYYYSYITNPDPEVYKLKGKIISYDEFLASQD